MKRKLKMHRAKIILSVILAVVLLLVFLLGIYLYQNTKNDFLWLNLSQLEAKSATTLYIQNENEEFEIYAQLPSWQEKIWVDIEDIPLQLQQAFIAIEDQDFYSHIGFSISRTIFAAMNELVYMLTGEYIGGEDGMMQGASTLTQQLVKNLTADDSQSGFEGYLRKIREIYRAVLLEIEYDKQTILQAYLNIISFTGDTAGVQAESIKLFGKPVSELTLEQCASIAAITKNPSGYNPVTNPDAHLARRNYILFEMYNQDYITLQEYESASAMPLGLNEGEVQSPNYINRRYFTDEIIEVIGDELKDSYNLSDDEVEHILYYSGINIYTSLSADELKDAQNLKGNIIFSSVHEGATLF